MSLLLEALKKAELAKQGAQSSRAEPTLATEPTITRSSLQDMSQPVEVLATGFPDEVPATGASRDPSGSPLNLDGGMAESGYGESMGSPNAMAKGAVAVDSLAPGMGDPVEPAQVTPEQKAAKQMFEAKEVDYNPRRPFYITIGVLVLCGAGYGGYVWWQMQPRSIYNAAAAKSQSTKGADQPAPPAERAPPATVEPANSAQANSPLPPQVDAPAPSNPATAAAPAQSGTRSSPPAVAGSPQAPSAPRAQETRLVSPAPSTGLSSTTAAPAAAPRRAPANNAGDGPSISIAQQAPAIDPLVEQAYASFQKGEFGNARELYQAALKRDASSRDALLGLAAIDMRAREFGLAEARYLRLLENDPRDADALAGLIALRGQVDPTQSESRLKTLIASQPEASQLHFALGNLLASQKRWNEAQAAYFKAYSLEPESPDFAFNLAVSLDQMRQIRPALEYYRRAVALAGSRSAGFDKAVATSRIAELSRP
jgi:Flp pilus assembly protein TadD